MAGGRITTCGALARASPLASSTRVTIAGGTGRSIHASTSCGCARWTMASRCMIAPRSRNSAVHGAHQCAPNRIRALPGAVSAMAGCADRKTSAASARANWVRIDLATCAILARVQGITPAGRAHIAGRFRCSQRRIRSRKMRRGRTDFCPAGRRPACQTGLTLAGGLTSRVSLNDVSLRSDAASRQITDQSNSVATDVIRGSSCPPKWRLFSRNSARITCGVTGLAMGGTQIPDPISPLANRYRCHRCRPRSLVVSP